MEIRSKKHLPKIHPDYRGLSNNPQIPDRTYAFNPIFHDEIVSPSDILAHKNSYRKNKNKKNKDETIKDLSNDAI